MSESAESINYYPSRNNNKLYNNKTFVQKLITSIRYALKKANKSITLPSLSKEQINVVINLLKTTNSDKFIGHTEYQVLDILTNFMMDQLKNANCNYADVDIHEMQKAQLGLRTDVIEDKKEIKQSDQTIANTVIEQITGMVGISSFMGSSSLTDLLRYISPSSVIKQAYISLDTKNRSLNNDGTSYFQWTANNLASSIGQGDYYLDSNVRDIVEIRVLPIKMPYVSSADNDYGRITMYVNEYSSQAYVNANNLRYHFIYSSDIIDRWIHLRTYTNNEGVYKFATPITQLSSLTLTFASPFDNILFDLDRLNNFTVYDYDTLNKTWFYTPSQHNLETGDRVYITGFTTLNPAPDQPIISNINIDTGLIVTTVDTNRILVDVNSSSIYELGVGSITLTNGSNIIIGTSTTFISLFQQNDQITYNGNSNIITNVTSDTSLTVNQPWSGVTTTFPVYYRDNRVPNLGLSMYFGSKRLFINMQVSYLYSASTKS